MLQINQQQLTVIRHINEKTLVMQVAEGDERAFEELFCAYHNQPGSYVAGWTKSTTLTEEVVQDVFLKIWTNRDALKEVEPFDSYLYIVSRNHAFNALRQTAKRGLKRQECARLFENGQEFTADTSNEEYFVFDRCGGC